jgi:hypothetical protein
LWEFPVDDGLVLVRPDVQGFFLLNKTARLVWRDFNQGLALAEIVAGLVAHFCIPPEVARRDIEAAIASWRDGLLSPSPPSVRLPPGLVTGTEVCPVDCLVNGNPMRVVLELGEVWDEIAPRLEPVRIEAPDPRYTFTVGSSAGRVLVFRDGICIGDEENSAGARAILLQAMASLTEPLAILHAGGCGGVLLAGQSHCGKSTLCAALMGRGLAYYCDDSAVLDREFRVTPMPFPVMLRSGSWPSIEDRFPAFKDSPVYRRWDTEVRFLTPVTAPGPAAVTALIFVRHERGAETQLAELSVLDSLLALQRSGFWVEHARESIERFLSWLAGIGRYNLRYSKLEDAEGIVVGLAAKATAL